MSTGFSATNNVRFAGTAAYRVKGIDNAKRLLADMKGGANTLIGSQSASGVGTTFTPRIFNLILDPAGNKPAHDMGFSPEYARDHHIDIGNNDTFYTVVIQGSKSDLNAAHLLAEAGGIEVESQAETDRDLIHPRKGWGFAEVINWLKEVLPA